MRWLIVICLIAVFGSGSGTSTALAQRQPVYPAPSAGSTERLLKETADVRKMTEAQLAALVPEQSGLHYVGCPNCRNGRQENQLTWSIQHPDKVLCQFCQHEYPSPQYPMTKSVRVQTPSHGKAEYPYWEDASGYRFFFDAKRDDLKRRFAADQAHKLAWLYQETHDEAYARRALLILNRFADVFPNWCYHYDYPFRQKEIVDGPITPAQFRPGYRTARWTWWAYSDIPVELIKAYDWLVGSRAFAELNQNQQRSLAKHIEQDLFLSACEQVLGNPETYSNMSPRAWQSLTIAGRVLNKPEYVQHVVRSMEQMVVKNFFYDGTWCEGSPDYEHQTVDGLQRIIDALQGYEDLPSFEKSLGVVRLALRGERMLLPDGRSVPVHDTWPGSKHAVPSPNQSRLWPGLGHACLSATFQDISTHKPAETQFHLTWSGGYGHSHADNLSVLFFSRGREALSDLGYTHTAYRAWTLATAAHNTVVIDGQNQQLGNRSQPTDGRLLFSQLNDERFQVVIADGSRGYPNLAQQYARAAIMVTSRDVAPYTIDIFDVQGGRTHDYFLHGWADGPSTVTASLETQPRTSLHPDPTHWQAPKNEGQTSLITQPYYAYGFLKDLRSSPASPTLPITVDFKCQASKNLANSNLQVRLFAEENSELILGENPSIRQAREDDARLEDFQRPCMVLRHNSEGKSRFISVIEEFVDRSTIRSVENLSTDHGVVLKIQLRQSADQPERPTCQWIMLDVTEPVQIECLGSKMTFQGKLGFLSHNAKVVDRISCSGQASWQKDGQTLLNSHSEQARIVAIADETLTLEGTQAVPPSGTALVQTNDGWTYPIQVQAAVEQGGRIQVRARELHAFQWEASQQKLTGKMFPQREHQGPLTLQWFTPAKSKE